MIRFEHVSKLYGDKEALSDLNVTIENGEIFWSYWSQWCRENNGY